MLWIFEFFFGWILKGLFPLGVVSIALGVIVSLIPTKKIIGMLILLVGAILTTSGAFYYGVSYKENQFNSKIAEMRIEMANLEAKASKVTVEVVTEYIYRDRIIRERGNDIIREVPVYITKENDDQCILPESFRLLHNRATASTISGATRSTDAKTTPTK